MRGDTGFLTHEAALQRQVETNDALAERYPAVLILAALLRNNGRLSSAHDG